MLAKRFVYAKNQRQALRLKKNLGEKVAKRRKKTKGVHKKFGLVRDSNTRSPASRTSGNPN